MNEFNWLEALQCAIEHEPDAVEFDALCAAAGDWPTCACGELCKRLPRYEEDGVPMDITLAELGIVFNVHVKRREWNPAFVIFREIEQRTTELILQ